MNDQTELRPDPRNANAGTDRGRQMVADSLKECGAGRSILADRDGVVIAGNKTLEAAQALGLAVRIIESSGDELVVVKRTDLLLEEGGAARRLAYLDNRSSELGLEWDARQVLDDLEAGIQLDGLFSDAELKRLLEDVRLPDPVEDPGADLDRADELQEKWQVQPGQIWTAGKHRLMCADCTDAAAVAELLAGKLAHICWTDPPWNVAYGKSGANPRWRTRSIENDDLGEEFPAFAQQFCEAIAGALIPGAPIYLAMSAQEWPTIHAALREAGFHWSSTIIWVKDHAVLSRKDYHTRYEPVWYGWKLGSRRMVPMLDRTQNDVWEIPRPSRSEEHPTMKPVELVTRSLKNSSFVGDLVFEPFLGSGTTAVAAEQTGRACYAMELEPKYVAVTLERLSGMGLTPEVQTHGNTSEGPTARG